MAKLLFSNLIAVKILYWATVSVVPQDVVARLNTLFFNFLWSGKRDRIKRSVIIGDYETGGLKMLDIASYIEALHAGWVKRILDQSFGDWKLLPKLFLNRMGDDLLILKMHFKKKEHCPELPTIPTFYQSIIQSWHKAGGGAVEKPCTADEVGNHIIWGSEYLIDGKTGKTLFYKHWINSGIICINDLFNANRPELKDKRNWISETYIVQKAIPRSWLSMLNNSGSSRVDNADNKCGALTGYSCKILYRMLLKDKITVPYMQTYWQNRLVNQTSITWGRVWQLQTIKLSPDRILSEFGFKIFVLTCIKQTCINGSLPQLLFVLSVWFQKT